MTTNLNSITLSTKIKSRVPGINWPALLDPDGAQMLAAQYQLAISERMPAEQLLNLQQAQLEELLVHAYKTVPYYRKLFRNAGITPGRQAIETIWPKIPVLQRSDLQAQSDGLLSSRPPAEHGKLNKKQSSGSTGRPVTAYGTSLTGYFWRCFALRDHLWHQRDLGGKLFIIRRVEPLKPGQVTKQSGWGPTTEPVFHTGPAICLDIRTDVETQARLLREHNPDYLLSYPSNLVALGHFFLRRNQKLKNLKEVRTLGEICSDETRDVCREAWGVPVKDMYSAQEVGYIALQCPDHEHHHVQSEGIFVEILDDQNQQVPPGGVGRVVVTPLHNFAMPLIRYALGDYAEVGAPCPCGRSLPVLTKILGRKRNMALLPDGRQVWPSFPAKAWGDNGKIRQLQLVQKTKELIVARMLADEKLSPHEAETFVRNMQERFGFPFRFELEYPAAIERSSGGKYEDFLSEL